MSFEDMSREQLVRELERLRRQISERDSVSDDGGRITVSGIDIEWDARRGICTFAGLPVAMMWIDTTLMGLMSGLQAMVGEKRFNLALQSEGRRSVKADWKVISGFPNFQDGFNAIAVIAAVAGWGEWKLASIDENKKECRYRAWNSWEGRYQKAQGVCWGSGMLAGKLAGYCSNLFNTNCWAEQTAFIARGDDFDEFVVKPSEKSIEKEIQNLLATDEATRADMAVALKTLEKEIAERERTDEELRYRSEFENLISRTSARFIDIPSDSIDENIEVALKEISLFAGADAGYVFEFSSDWSEFTMTHLWKNEKLSLNMEELRDLPVQSMPWWMERIGNGEVVAVPSVDDLPAEAALEKSIIEAQGIRSLVDVPMISQGTVIGVVGFDSAVQHRQWSEDEISLLRMVGQVFTSVLHRKRTEEALRESEENYREIFNATSEAIFIHDAASGKILDVNQPMLDMFGFSREEEVLRFTIDDLSSGRPPYTQSEGLERIKAAVTMGPQLFEWRSRRKDGKLFWSEVALRSSEIAGEGRVLAVVRDITERKKAEQERIKLTTALEQAAETVIITDLEGRIQYTNPAFERSSGYSRLEAEGRKVDMLGSGQRHASFHQEIWGTITRGEVWSGRFINKRKDGTLFHMEATISPLRDETGAIVNYVSVQRDVTEELDLKAQLQQAQKMEAVGTLAGGIAHDFNNILQAIQGYAEIVLLEKREDESGYREVSEIAGAAKRGSELTQQLLAFSRKLESNLQPVNLNTQVERTKKLLERTIPKMIDIELVLDRDLKVVNADVTQIEQVLLNLAVNAKDAMLEGGKLTIETGNVYLGEEYCRTKPETKPGEYVLMTVTDTGRGIDEETLMHVFDPFFTTKGRAKGTGLGLSMVYGTVKNHGGQIECHSKVGFGTTFKIYLPVVDQEVEEQGSPEPELPRGGDETILLVDDEESIRELGKQMLTRFGYTVLTAADGETALEVYRKEHQQLDLYRDEQSRIDLVILDLIMPGIGGGKCLKRILEINPKAKILVSSGYSDDGPIRGSLKAGAVGFVSKPYDIKRLLREVRDALDRD
jgi:PAS domain S-box-containing protein